MDLDLRQCFVVICTAGPSTVPTHSRGLLRQCVWDDLIVDKGRGLGICQVWLRMSQGIEVTQRQYCAKYLMFSSYLNLIRPPGGRTISIFFFVLVAPANLSDLSLFPTLKKKKRY